jgi:hypothetical protein
VNKNQAMKTLFKNLKYLFLITGLILLFSCKKTTENKLEGTWKMINIYNINDTLNIERWNFASDGKLNIYRDENGVPAADPRFVFRYNVKSYKKMIVEPLGSDPPTDYCREWKIAKLRKDIMIISYESGGLVQKEFERL